MNLKININSSGTFFLFLLFILNFFFSLLIIISNSSFLIEWKLLHINSSTISFPIFLDWISSIFLRFVCLISAIILSYRKDYILKDIYIDRFIYLVLSFVFSIRILILRPNIISILLGWDGLGLISFILVIYYQNEKSANAGILTILSNRIGDVAILLSIPIILQIGRWNFIYLNTYFQENNLLHFLIILAALTKRAQIPFSAWLPAAIAAPTPVSALVHSSTLVTAGVYLLIRFRSTIIKTEIKFFLLIISTFTIFSAGLRANFEYDLKKIIALSTLRQLGIIISTLAIGLTTLSFFHLLTHAIFKALLFICAGRIIHNVKNYQDIRNIGNISKFLPLSSINLNLANLSLCGFPFLAGFYSKDLILEITLINNLNFIVFILFIFSTGLTVSYSLRLTFLSLLKSFNLNTITNISDESKNITSSILPLSVGAIILGRLLAWLILPEPHIIILTPLFKSLIILIRIIGAIIGYISNIININFNLKTLNFPFILSFIRSIWFLQFSSTQIRYSVLYYAQTLQTSLDKGWFEYLGGQGSYHIVTSLRTQLQILQNRNIKLFLKRFFLLVIFFTLTSTYSHNLI